MKIALYVRTSTNDGRQSLENQIVPLKELASRLGGNIIHTYSDEASGAKGDRKALQDMLDAAHRQEFDVLLLWSLDRLSREGIAKLFSYLERLKKLGIRVMSLQESWLDTQSPTSDLLISIFGWIAQQERRRIQERVHAGLAQARLKGKTLGRPKRPVDVTRARELISEGHSIRKVSAMMGVPRPTLHRYLSQNPIEKEG